MRLPDDMIYRHVCPPECKTPGEQVQLRPQVEGSFYLRPSEPYCVYTHFPLARVMEEEEAPAAAGRDVLSVEHPLPDGATFDELMSEADSD